MMDEKIRQVGSVALFVLALALLGVGVVFYG